MDAQPGTPRDSNPFAKAVKVLLCVLCCMLPCKALPVSGQYSGVWEMFLQLWVIRESRHPGSSTRVHGARLRNAARFRTTLPGCDA